MFVWDDGIPDESSRSLQVERQHIEAMNSQLCALLSGIGAVLPVSCLPLFTPEELEVVLCGSPDIDVDLLKKVTEYEDGLSEGMPHIKYFWETLEKFDQSQRGSFVNFVSARSRLPNSVDEFPMNFKIQNPKPSAREHPDVHFPHSQTCFFTLSLPFYSAQPICEQKLRYAMENSPNMDDDYNNREQWGVS